MKNLGLLIIIFLFCGATQAENSQIVNCRVKNKEWSSLFILDNNGESFLTFIKANDSNTYTCGLKVDDINNSARAVSPEVKIDFELGHCEPELGDLEKEIFDSFTLMINITNKDKPTGRVQWLRRKQPDPCVVEKFNFSEIATNAKKLSQGKWGRQIASDPKTLAPRKKKR